MPTLFVCLFLLLFSFLCVFVVFFFDLRGRYESERLSERRFVRGCPGVWTAFDLLLAKNSNKYDHHLPNKSSALGSPKRNHPTNHLTIDSPIAVHQGCCDRGWRQ